MQRILEKSRVKVGVQLKSIEILIPDNVNYELSKFLILQTGDIQVKSGDSSKMSVYFNKKDIFTQQIHSFFLKKVFNAQAGSVESSNDDSESHSVLLYDLRILYLPTVDHLENYLFNDNY